MASIDEALDLLAVALGGRPVARYGAQVIPGVPVELQQWLGRLPLPRQVPWYGDCGMSLRSASELDDAQTGYRFSADGTPSPSWPASWIVIGDVSGDPVIARTDIEGVPVEYAVHGTGTWNPEPLAPSLAAFAEALAKWIGKAGSESILTDDDELRPEVVALVQQDLVHVVGSSSIPVWLGKHWLD